MVTAETRRPDTLTVPVDVRPYGSDHNRTEQVRARVYEALDQAEHLADAAGEDDSATSLAAGTDRARQRTYGDVDGVPFHRAEHLPLADFGEFHAEHRRRLIALVRTVLVQQGWHDGVDVEDIVQDTLELAVLNWPRIGRMKEPGGYLRTVAVNKAYRAMGKSLRELSVSSDSLLAFFDGSLASGFERSPEEIVTADFARDLLRSLPQRQAQVLVLTADGWTDSQIGKMLDLHPATVRSHRRYARKVLLERRERIMGARALIPDRPGKADRVPAASPVVTPRTLEGAEQQGGPGALKRSGPSLVRRQGRRPASRWRRRRTRSVKAVSW
ncbi:sigma-70 family RNA polymerase sigma factor [Streptomyces sp. NRRL S-495]|uniref:RNA polymerase sigma factor n=1 Tax=Streptomyces sp. NRRL S-495 TaxID=1609133 RepID=UPI0005F97709|nr:sigma-70 family RNA polymerase sigma factor [Streptomyces sp. NRRL S-495]KJY32158.1 hypothetical protein VR45_23365 [Streptomyces sp. NRRL S-495]